ncbi:hypothetical protein [uncultured Pseudokineococcus sp.]|uniref:hypothetical protein n=1 Tax=uncultured Pseudokineococcus sp. TaxID=1642928 RepID=UPI0026362FDA|nr:hypothetical protein [uncultured Pseudokineococcus sp.]
MVLLVVAAYLLFEVAARSGGFGDAQACLEDLPYSPPHEEWQADVQWSWWPLGARCTYLNPENGDVAVAALAWRDTLLVALPALAGVGLLARAAFTRRR